MISVIIPVVDNHETTWRCIDNLINYSGTDSFELIIVDNGSDPPYKDYTDDDYDGCKPFDLFCDKIITNTTNPGVYQSLLQGIEAATNDIIVLMHNDVLIWEQDWDTQIKKEFEKNPKLGIAGLFGGRGVGYNGGRIHPESNMLGKEWGQAGMYHSHLLTETHPACVFDSLFLVIRKEYFNLVNIPEMPPHHWFDRILTLLFIEAGYHALTIGIGFDHAGGGTSSNGKTTMADFTAQWCKNHNLDIVENPDYTLYKYGEKLFQTRFEHILPLSVDQDFNYMVRSKRVITNKSR